MIVKDLIPGMGAKAFAITEKLMKTRPARRFPAETGTSRTRKRAGSLTAGHQVINRRVPTTTMWRCCRYPEARRGGGLAGFLGEEGQVPGQDAAGRDELADGAQDQACVAEGLEEAGQGLVVEADPAADLRPVA